MKRGLIVAPVLMGIILGIGCGLTKAADVEVILGTSSGFKIVRGTSISSGTSTFFVGSSTVSIGTTTQAAMLTIAGSSTSSSDAALKVGTATLWVGNDGSIGIGTTTPSATGYKVWVGGNSFFDSNLYAPYTYIGSITAYAGGSSGTVTVYGNAEVTGTLTAAKFIGDGSALSGITATFLGSASNINTTGTINAGSTTVSTFTTTGSITAGSAGGFKVDAAGSMTATTITTMGSVTASTLAITGNVFKVDSAGSMTATTITSTGSMTVSGTLTAASDSFRADTDAIKITSRLGIGTTTPSSLYMLQVTNDSDAGVVFSSGGSMTAKTLAVTGTATVTGTLTAGNALRVDTNTLVVDATNNRVGIGTTTPATELHVTGTITATGFSGPGASKIFIRKSVDEIVNGTSTPQNDDELLFAIPANETWLTDVFLTVTTLSGTPDMKYAFTAPAGLTSITYGHYASSAAISTSSLVAGTGLAVLFGAGANTCGVSIKCLVVNGANAGTVTFQWAQNTGTAENTTVKAGSFLLSTRLQ